MPPGGGEGMGREGGGGGGGGGGKQLNSLHVCPQEISTRPYTLCFGVR
jgi:hypothetical protein